MESGQLSLTLALNALARRAERFVVKEQIDVLNKCSLHAFGGDRVRSHGGAVVGMAVTILTSEFELAPHKAFGPLWLAL